jgi:hypothetical protein
VIKRGDACSRRSRSPMTRLPFTVTVVELLR